MNYTTLIVTKPKEGIQLVTLSRPKARNSVNGAMIRDVITCLDAASVDPEVRCVVITGDPKGKAFSAGADLSPEANSFETNENASTPHDVTAETYKDGGGLTSFAALNCVKPVICAINGPAVGWGLAFPLAADMRVVSETAKVGFTMAARG